MAEGGYEVWVHDLHVASGHLGGDASAMSTAGERGVGSAHDAAAACSGDLAAALGEIAEELRQRCTGMELVITGAADAARGSAARYEGDDTDVARRYDGMAF